MGSRSLRISIALVVSMVFASHLVAQGDFFFSFTEGGENSDQTAEFEVGDTGSLWVYWSTNGPADSDLDVGAFIDVFTSTLGVIEFTAAETFDYEHTVNGEFFTYRYGINAGFGPANDVSPDFIDELIGTIIGASGNGIQEIYNGSGTILDSGYDPTNDGFNWGRIDFDVVGVGTTSVTGVAGDGNIVNGDQIVDAAFTTATINVVGIPEPSAVCFLCLGLAGIGVGRRR